MDNNIVTFDPDTGKPVLNNQNIDNNQKENLDQNQNNQNDNIVQFEQPANTNKKEKKKLSTGIKVFIILSSIFIFLVLLGITIFFVISGFSKKLVCTSNEGDITIMYTKNQITGYVANGIIYDLDGQKKIANEIGVESYLDKFELWFKKNTTGSCKR